VDVWSIGVITYTLLCGYTPFRSEDRRELIAETTRAKIEFHERYWKNVSQEAKNFVLTLIKPDPAERPTAHQALELPWLTTSSIPDSVDLSSSIRENWNPRRKWRSAINAVQMAGRLNKSLSLRQANNSSTTSNTNIANIAKALKGLEVSKADSEDEFLTGDEGEREGKDLDGKEESKAGGSGSRLATVEEGQKVEKEGE